MDGFLGYSGDLWVKKGIKMAERAKPKVCSLSWAPRAVFLWPLCKAC